MVLIKINKELQEEQQQRKKLEQELAEWRKQPPKVTPRTTATPRSPSPPQPPPRPLPPAPPGSDLIYLPDYCPLTLRAVQENPSHLVNFRRYAEKMLEENLDEVGIDKVSEGVS